MDENHRSGSSGLPAPTASLQRQLDRGWTEQYLPDTNSAMFGRTPFSMLFGAIRDARIAAVEVRMPTTGQVKQTELLQGVDGSRIWMLLLPATGGTRFELRAADRDGAVVSVKQVDESQTSGGGAGFNGTGSTEPVPSS